MRKLSYLITAALAATIVTSQAAEGGSNAAAESAPALEWGDGIKCLLIGGGSSHDYDKWFNEYDSKLLKDTGKYAPLYFEPPQVTVEAVKQADVILTSANMNFTDPEVKAAMFAHVEAGKGMILLHPGLWNSYRRDWPEYNKVLAGGGAGGHDRLGEFEVTVIKPDHVLVKDVPATFSIVDELYYFQPDEDGTPIEVLATAKSNRDQREYPQVFVIKNPNARMVGITLGHDGRAHEHEAYQQLLLNAFDWVSQLKE